MKSGERETLEGTELPNLESFRMLKGKENN